MTAWCEMTDLPASGCAHCQGLADGAAPRPKTTTAEREHHAQRAFPARFEGRCPAPGCPDLIREGDLIESSSHGFVHEGCG